MNFMAAVWLLVGVWSAWCFVWHDEDAWVGDDGEDDDWFR